MMCEKYICTIKQLKSSVVFFLIQKSVPQNCVKRFFILNYLVQVFQALYGSGRNRISNHMCALNLVQFYVTVLKIELIVLRLETTMERFELKCKKKVQPHLHTRYRFIARKLAPSRHTRLLDAIETDRGAELQPFSPQQHSSQQTPFSYTPQLHTPVTAVLATEPHFRITWRHRPSPEKKRQS